MKMNTMEKEKHEIPNQDYSGQKSSNETIPELEKLNEQIAELTTKNIELTVGIKLY